LKELKQLERQLKTGVERIRSKKVNHFIDLLRNKIAREKNRVIILYIFVKIQYIYLKTIKKKGFIYIWNVILTRM
jgi:flagellar biosynthesis chaperone FliJ